MYSSQFHISPHVKGLYYWLNCVNSDAAVRLCVGDRETIRSNQEKSHKHTKQESQDDLGNGTKR